MGVGRCFSPSATAAHGSTGRPVSPQPSLFGGSLVGSPRPGRHGDFCPRNFLRPPPAGGVSSSGKKKVYGCNAWRAFLRELDQRGTVGLGRIFSRWQLRFREKGGSCSWENQAGQRHEVDGIGRRSRSSAGSSARKCLPSEVNLAEATLAEVRVPRAKGRPRQKPERVIADRGYDSDPLRQRLRRRGIDLIVPYRQNNRHRRYEDGASCDGTSAADRGADQRLAGQFRRLLVRHEHLLCTYRAFFYLACFWITLRRCS